MDQDRFEALLIEFKHRKPFVPFVVEMTDGRVLYMDGKGLAINPPDAAYLTPEHELVIFNCGEVRDIRALTHQVPA